MNEPVFDLIVAAAFEKSSHVSGTASMPALSKMSLRYRVPRGPVSCGTPHTPPLYATCFHTQSTYLLSSPAAPYGVRSARLFVCVNDEMFWYSICATSGMPLPAFSALRSFG